MKRIGNHKINCSGFFSFLSATWVNGSFMAITLRQSQDNVFIGRGKNPSVSLCLLSILNCLIPLPINPHVDTAHNTPFTKYMSLLETPPTNAVALLLLTCHYVC